MQCHLFILAFVPHAAGDRSREVIAQGMSETVPPRLSPGSYVAAGLTLQSLIYFEFRQGFPSPFCSGRAGAAVRACRPARFGGGVPHCQYAPRPLRLPRGEARSAEELLADPAGVLGRRHGVAHGPGVLKDLVVVPAL